MGIAPAKENIHPIIIVHAVTAAGLHDFYFPDQERVWSPLRGSSTLITSAPWSARIMVAHGPDSIEVRSTIRVPASGPIGTFHAAQIPPANVGLGRAPIHCRALQSWHGCPAAMARC